MTKLLGNEIWALVICFVTTIACYTVLGILAPEAGTLLRAVVISLASGIVGYAGGRTVGSR